MIILIYRIQNEGLGGLRPNTILINWPENWNQSFLTEKNIETHLNSINFGEFMRIFHKNFYF